jgi:hypothetical protein
MRLKIGNNKYQIELSDKPNKKLMMVKPKKVYFGATGYEHYYDKTGLLPKSLNHNDTKRRDNYRARHKNDKLNDPTSAGFLSRYVLW